MKADREAGGSLWSFSRRIVNSRLLVLDSREGRVLRHGQRAMLDEGEWRWAEAQLSGDFDHLLVVSTLPVLLSPTLHYLEAWNEAVCAGAWGKLAARIGEKVRRAIDLEHWAAPGLLPSSGSHARGARLGAVGASSGLNRPARR